MSLPQAAISYDVFPLADVQQDAYGALRDRVNGQLQEFKCERSPHLQSFARGKVHTHESTGFSRTYVMIAPSGDTIDVAGFFTVGMASMSLANASNSVKKKLVGAVGFQTTGAFCIAELARSDDYTSTQLPGITILQEAMRVVKKAQTYIGGRFVVVDARPEVFEKLYQPAGFKQIATAEPPLDMPDVEFITACALVKNW